MQRVYKIINVLSILLVGFGLSGVLMNFHILPKYMYRPILFTGMGLYFFTWGLSTFRKENHLITNRKSADNPISRIIRVISIAALAVGLIFKLMHWPGASLLLIVALVLGLVAMVFYLIAPKTKFNDDDDSWLDGVIDDIEDPETNEIAALKDDEIVKMPLAVRLMGALGITIIGFAILTAIFEFDLQFGNSFLFIILGSLLIFAYLVVYMLKYRKS